MFMHVCAQMIDVIHWCLEMGVPCISVYAFSIDNFKRSSEEVGSLMQLAEEKYNELAKVSQNTRNQQISRQYNLYSSCINMASG